jgi:hypothetical protein
MRFKLVIVLGLLTAFAQAKEPRHYQSGTLLQMDSVQCGVDENSGKSVAGEIFGTDGAHKKTHEMLCQEYLVQTERVLYRIRPKDEKHPALLLVGQSAQFRLAKDKMVLRVEDGDDKERDYVVVSMTPRESSKSVEASASKPNHN